MDAVVSFDDSCELTVNSELDLYLKHPVKKSDFNAKEWWNENAKIYPNLFSMFKKFSCIPATSAGSERTFSLTGDIVTEKEIVFYHLMLMT